MEKQYKVLIVEDETLIAQGLKYMTEHAGLPCEVTGVADDGIQGYEMARQLKPDIVINDSFMQGFILGVRALNDRAFRVGAFFIRQHRNSGYFRRPLYVFLGNIVDAAVLILRHNGFHDPRQNRLFRQ